MRLLMITGFLGSGKTTLVVELVEAAIAQGQRVAILVNEIGEVGIDDQLLRQLGLNVWEMVNGCICCTLAAEVNPNARVITTSVRKDLSPQLLAELLTWPN